MIFTIIALVDGSDKELATEKDINSHRYELLVDGISGDITVDFDKINWSFNSYEGEKCLARLWDKCKYGKTQCSNVKKENSCYGHSFAFRK